MPLTNLSWAMYYVSLGWAIIPQVPATKMAAAKWKHRQLQVGTDPAWARDRWTEHPDHGVLLLLGPPSGVAVVDVDGRAAYDVLVDRLGCLPRTIAVKSGNPDPYRFHLLFSISPDLPSNAKCTPWHDKLEQRGHGGVVVLPPSLHKSGNRYYFFHGHAPWECALAPLPPLLAEEWRRHLNPRALAKPKQSVPVAASCPAKPLALLPNLAHSTRVFLTGARAYQTGWNNALFRAACDLCGVGVLVDVAEPALLAAAKPITNVDKNAARATIRSAYSRHRQPARKYRHR